MTYQKLTEKTLKKLASIVGEEFVRTQPDVLQTYSHDEVSDTTYHHLPEAVVFPQSTEEIAAIMKLANVAHFPVVPRGGGTGLACGAVPLYGGVVLSTERMDRILALDPAGLYAIVEPGVRTADLQAAAAAKGLFYAGDPCSSDSCCIGGNIATNAGGNRAVKYGTTRHQIYALTVVTPTGDIVQTGARLKKQSTGYCLEQLIAGSEGTLGIITQATLKLLPRPKQIVDILAIFPTPTKAIDTAACLLQAGLLPTCIEFMDEPTLRSIEAYLHEPLPGKDKRNYVIIEMDGTEEEMEPALESIDTICQRQGATDILVADYKKIWRARKAFAEAVRAESLLVSKEDVVVPIERQGEFFHIINDLAHKYNLITRIAGHIGDGNIHLNILKPAEESYLTWQKRVTENQTALYTALYQLGGRLSGEHGIGAKRRDLMERFTDPATLALMKTIKKALDPQYVLNPGKIFDISK
ncbi:FAD-binding oxidoreductase [uncultured Megasphaera sp.]|uniref:FAD-binding oxidoreductase n=1 Tax=uncultured Megasphaera sp. TaxID=165188 RepID=UPI002592D3B5|nr:FAD-binding oxidoreductase [uncultured Megasphaera sp.]